MIPAQFNYTAPESLDEAVEQLQANAGAKILAGGQILLPEMKLRQALPSMLVDLRKIQGEIIISVDFPSHVAGTGSAYCKFKHPANYYSVCGVAAKIFRSPNGAINKCCVAVTGVTDRARRLGAVETILEGKEVTADNIAAAALQANEELTFLWDLYASGEYRAYLTRLLTEKALACAAERGTQAD